MKNPRTFVVITAVALMGASALGQNNAVAWKNFAGLPGGRGTSDGSSCSARFNSPLAVAVDGSGNVYVADSVNNTIRKINTGGVVTTIAGLAGSRGTVDATGASARFNNPSGMAVDSAGNLYVADRPSMTIRKVTSDGVVTTLAGTANVSGSADGTGGAALFFFPKGVAADSAGNVYVADSFNNTIRKITTNGVVTTLAGVAGPSGSADGTGSDARFSNPEAVAVDTAGNVYVADTGNHTIRRVTSEGVVTTLAGTARQSGSDDGTGSAARFNSPRGVAVDDAGDVYVADSSNHTIRRVTSGGVVTTLAGSAGQYGAADGSGSAARFNTPMGLSVDSATNVYVADFNGQTIRKISSGGSVTTLAGSPALCGSTDGTGSTARFWTPNGLALETNGTFYVADSYTSIIRKITGSGVVTTLAGSAGSSGTADGTGNAARFNWPMDAAVDTNGTVYVADYQNHTIRKVTSAGVVTTLAGWAGFSGSSDGSGTGARFCYPGGIAVDRGLNVYVADTGNQTIRKISRNGFVTTFAGKAGVSGTNDATGTAARFNQPMGVAVDAAGNLYVADLGNHIIRKITSGAVVTTAAGLPLVSGSADGTGTTARFNQPWRVAVDSAGNVYVTDSGNSTIRKVTSAGVVTTIGGAVGLTGAADGIGCSALFAYPAGIAVDSTGALFVADTGNNRISKGTPGTMLLLDWSASGFSVSWPSPSTGLVLQQNTNLAAPDGWHDSGYTISDDGTNKSITVTSPTNGLFFRLVGH